MVRNIICGIPVVPALACILCGMLLVAGCTSGTGSGKESATGGTLKVTGSTTVLPVAQKAAEGFMDANPGTDIQISGGGSGVGIQAIGEKTVDIGMSSRDLSATEKAKYPGLVATPVALDGIAIIVNPGNRVESLTLDQIRGIYAGSATDWQDVGGTGGAIVVVGRDSASGTRTFFTESVMNKTDYVRTQLEKNSNGAVQQSVAQTPGAIGYVGLGYIGPAVKAVKISVSRTAIEPSVQTVLDKSYPISRSLYMVTNGEPAGLAKDYIGYILGPAGRKLVESEGFVPLP